MLTKESNLCSQPKREYLCYRQKPECGTARSIGAELRSLEALEVIVRTSHLVFALIGYCFTLLQHFLALPPFLPFAFCQCRMETFSLGFDCTRLTYTLSLRI